MTESNDRRGECSARSDRMYVQAYLALHTTKCILKNSTITVIAIICLYVQAHSGVAKLCHCHVFVALVEDNATMSSIRYFENHLMLLVQN